MQPLQEPRRGVAEVGEERDDPEAGVECDGIEDRPVAGKCLEQVKNRCPAAQAVGHQDQYDAEHGSAENVARVVEPEVDPHEVDDGCAQDGEPARGSIHEKDRHGQSEENRGVVAGERRPVVQRVRIDAERNLEVQGGIVQRTQVGGQSELYAPAEHACEERCEHADEDSGADLDMGVLEPDVPDEREQRQVGEHVTLDGPDAVVEDKETAREPVDGMQEEVVRTVPAKYHSESCQQEDGRGGEKDDAKASLFNPLRRSYGERWSESVEDCTGEHTSPSLDRKPRCVVRCGS